jgi:hypothetical protein
MTNQGKVGHDMAWHGKSRQGNVRKDNAMQGMAWKGMT